MGTEVKALTATEFVTVRLDEWEEAATFHRADNWWLDGGHSWTSDRSVELVGGGKTLAEFDDDHGGAAALHILLHDPARVLAQCAAMRTIVKKHATWERENRAAWKDYSRWVAGKPTPSKPPARTTSEDMHGLEFAVRALASIWSDHPDWREEWR